MILIVFIMTLFCAWFVYSKGFSEKLIVGTLGRLGKGKTLSGVIAAYEYFCGGGTVFSNIWLKFPHVPIRSACDFVNLKYGFFLGDELWSLADNRKAMSALNDVVSIICIRSRKRKFHVFHSEQYIQLDPRIRFITDYWIRPHVKPDNLSGLTPVYLKQDIWDGDGVRMKGKVYDVRPYLGLYDTEQDPYTIAESVTDEKLREAFAKALHEEPALKTEMEKLGVKAKGKEKVEFK